MLKTLPLLVPTHPILNAAMLYDAYTSLWLDHDDWRSNVTPQGKREIMCRLAWEVVKQKAVTLNLDRALTLLDASPQWLKSQIRNALIAAERVDYDLRTCTFLRRNSSGQYFFSHRSFQEYFCARYLVENLSD